MAAFESPKYIASLIAAINDGAKSAQLGALAFTAIGLFLLATAFSATDEDLLLGRTITISQLGGAQVPVAVAFGLAPAVFVAAHVYTLIRYDMLAGNLRQFLVELPLAVPRRGDRERCRQLLANVEFIQTLVASSESERSLLFAVVTWFMLTMLPLLVLLLVQISSLRLQHAVVNNIHHLCITADLLLLAWYYVRQAYLDPMRWPRLFPGRLLVLVLPLLAVGFDLKWLNVPGPDETTLHHNFHSSPRPAPDHETKVDRVLREVSNLWVQPMDLGVCGPDGAWGCRYLTVTHRPIVAKVWDSKSFVELRAGEAPNAQRMAAIESVSLHGRTLRFANLEWSEFFGADLGGAELQGANLSDAILKSANMDDAHLQGANLGSAQLQGASMIGAQLQGTNLYLARLQGAVLFAANLTGAGMSKTQLQGTDLRAGNLPGADLRGANLLGANLIRANLEGADLRDASLWNIHTNTGKLEWLTEISLSDLRGVDLSPPDDNARAKMLAGVPDDARSLIEMALVPRSDAGKLPLLGTASGPVLVTRTDDAAFASIAGEQHLTTDVASFDANLAAFLAAVAEKVPESAGTIADRAWSALELEKNRPLGRDLSCRLLALVEAKRITLGATTIPVLKDAEPCTQ